MAQADYDIAAHPSGVALRTEINTIFQAVLSNNSGATAPTTTVALMFWVDTSNGTTYYLKQRNHTNDAWVSMFAYDVASKKLQALSNGNYLAEITASTGAVLLPSGTTAQRPTLTTNDKALRFNTTLIALEYWNGTAWGSIGALDIDALTGKTTPVDADNLVISDSASSHILKKLTWANLKATLKTYFDTLYTAGIKLSTDGFSIIKNDNSLIKNQCVAWVNFDGTTTPPTIRDSYNVASVVRTATGIYDVYFNTPMDNLNYVAVSSSGATTTNQGVFNKIASLLNEKMSVQHFENNILGNEARICVQIFGGKN